MGGAHGFSETVDARGMLILGEPVEPLTDVIALEQTVGGDGAAARAVSAGVREKNGEVVSKQELRIAEHAGAVVAKTVQGDHGDVVWFGRCEEPSAELDVVARSDG